MSLAGSAVTRVTSRGVHCGFDLAGRRPAMDEKGRNLGQSE